MNKRERAALIGTTLAYLVVVAVTITLLAIIVGGIALTAHLIGLA